MKSILEFRNVNSCVKIAGSNLAQKSKKLWGWGQFDLDVILKNRWYRWQRLSYNNF